MILCCGDALIDMIPASATSPSAETKAASFVPHPGGAVFNTAISLGRLGVPTHMLTGISDDLFGTQLTRRLTESHVGTAYTIVSARPTTLAFVELNKGHATYTFYDENSAGRMIAPSDLPTLPDNISTLYFGGISLINEPAANTYLALAQREAPNRVIMLDPNIRSGFVTDQPAYRARLAALCDVADIIKVSDEDLDWLTPGPEPVMAKLKALRAERTAVMILTRGKDGATALLQNGIEVSVKPPQATVVDTVGAGDTFNAGVLAHLHHLNHLTKPGIASSAATPMTAALMFGAKVAAVSVARAGANPPWRAELEAINCS
ncbi:MAG: carbohydrate kinase [Paracoccaceae bacterium]|nr:carbohydrate kinase [Paracoccaceae bacterium]